MLWGGWKNTFFPFILYYKNTQLFTNICSICLTDFERLEGGGANPLWGPFSGRRARVGLERGLRSGDQGWLPGGQRWGGLARGRQRFGRRLKTKALVVHLTKPANPTPIFREASWFETIAHLWVCMPQHPGTFSVLSQPCSADRTVHAKLHGIVKAWGSGATSPPYLETLVEVAPPRERLWI